MYFETGYHQDKTLEIVSTWSKKKSEMKKRNICKCKRNFAFFIPHVYLYLLKSWIFCIWNWASPILFVVAMESRLDKANIFCLCGTAFIMGVTSSVEVYMWSPYLGISEDIFSSLQYLPFFVSFHLDFQSIVELNLTNYPQPDWDQAELKTPVAVCVRLRLACVGLRVQLNQSGLSDNITAPLFSTLCCTDVQ
jgi:hypothetical protein